MGVELYSKVLGIVGMGRIGSEVAKRAKSFGMKILAFDPFLSAKVAEGIGVEVAELKKSTAGGRLHYRTYSFNARNKTYDFG